MLSDQRYREKFSGRMFQINKRRPAETAVYGKFWGTWKSYVVYWVWHVTFYLKKWKQN